MSAIIIRIKLIFFKMRVILQLKNGSSFKYVSVIIDDTVVYYMWLSPNSEA